jgi:hypothetical protein
VYCYCSIVSTPSALLDLLITFIYTNLEVGNIYIKVKLSRNRPWGLIGL